MPENPKPFLETVADAIVEAQKPRVYGLYNYSSYPGDMPPHVVRHEPTNKIVECFAEPEPARELYERLAREHVAREVIRAALEWIQNDLYRYMVKVGLR